MKWVIKMNVKKLIQAVSVIEEVADAFNRMPEDQKESVAASLHCRIVSLYIIELAKHLQDGLEPYDACLAAVQGKTPLSDMGVSESKITLFKLLGAQGHKE